MIEQTYDHHKGLRITFSEADFHTLNRQARKHKLPLREFIEWMTRCYINSVRQEEMKKAG